MTKFIDFANFKVQKSSQFIIILALTFRVTVLIQQIFNFLLSNCFDSDNSVSSGSFSITVPWVLWKMQCVPSRPIPWDISQSIPMEIPYPWTSLQILALTDEKQFMHEWSNLDFGPQNALDASVTTSMSLPTTCEWKKNSGKTIVGVTSITMNCWSSVSVIVLSKEGSVIERSV